MGGAQEFFGIKPDLTIFRPNVVAGGYPMAAAWVDGAK